jgi:membrane-associated phospholipid phosphatase
MRHHITRFSLVAGIAALATACAETNTAPSGTDTGRSEIANAAVKFWEAGATVAWNQTARELVAARAVANPAAQLRIFAYLTLAQYNAIVTAEDTKNGGTHASPAAAVGGASVVVLKSFFPLDGALIDARLAEQLAATPWPGEKQKDAASGESVGRAVGTAVVAYAAAENFNVVPVPPLPVGPGFWFSSGAPIVRGLWGSRPFFLTSADLFRSAPPPAFGSPAFLADLAEIRTLSDTRTPDQLAIGLFWAPKVANFMNEVGAELIVTYKRSEREAAHILALANMAAFDAHIGCWDAKFAYWLIRPSQVDPAITLPLGLPNHPSYISGHSCNTASYATVFAHAFPAETALLEDYTTEAGLSRMYLGIHYRFDITAGQELGRDVAEWAMAHDVVGHEPFPLD